MAFCGYCGTQLSDTHAFCFKCGKPVAGAVKQTALELTVYDGKMVTFPLAGQNVEIPGGMDAFNYYRKKFNKLARMKANDLRAEYNRSIVNLDAFLTNFPKIYAKHRKPLLDAAMDILAQKDIYDISPEQFEQQHTADFCLCGEDVDVIIDSFNKTIEANQHTKAKAYGMVPGMVFRGLGGFATALAYNVAVNAIAEADIKRANVTPRQRAELFSRIKTDALMERAYVDYWRVFLSMTYVLNSRGFDVWYPNEQDNNAAAGIFQNLSLGRIPQEKIPMQTVQMLKLNPYAEGHLGYLRQNFGSDGEVQDIIDYFSLG